MTSWVNGGRDEESTLSAGLIFDGAVVGVAMEAADYQY